MNIEHCSACGAECAAASFPSHDLRVMAIDAEGRIFCQVCASDIDRRMIAERVPTCAYIASDGRHLTTWAGEPLAHITYEGAYRGGFHGSPITCWNARTPGGVELYGRCGGRGMVTSIRYKKVAR